MSDWDHKSEWRKRGKGFMVTVSRHDVEVSEYDYDEGPHRWAVYAYIYPAHHMFSQFIPDGDMWQEAATALPLHGGPSFFRTHYADETDREKVSAFQIGGDYNYLHDCSYTLMDDDSFDSGPIAHDAQELFDALTLKEQPE